MDSVLSTPPPALTTALAGRYVLGREIGRGGMATVYLARDTRHDRDVAVKVLAPALMDSLGAERFLREIKLVAQLQHPHILPLFDSGESGGLIYYVMPYVSGDSLRARLDRERTMAVDEAVRIAAEVAEALAFAHRHGIVHRDVKPANILLHEGHAIVADFGVARARDGSSTALTQTGVAIGTIAYMSPEQASGDDVDGRSDVYALGCMLYEMLAGELPFAGANPQAMLARRFTEAPPAIRTVRAAVPESVERIILRGMATEPADRFGDASELAAALTRARSAETGAVRSRPVSPEARRLCDDAIATLRRADFDLAVTAAVDSSAQAARAAIELETDLGEAHAAIGLGEALLWNWAEAERSLRRGVETAPGSALVHHWFGILLTARGRFDEARAAIDRALAIEPASSALHAARGAVDLYARDAASAQRALRRAIQCDPTSANAHVLLGIALAGQTLFDQAVAELERSLDLAGRMQPFMLGALTHALASAGHRANALEARTKLIDLANRYDISSFHLAAAHAAVGDTADALAALDRAVERRDTWLLALKVHPWMDPLRREARFKDMLAELEL